MVLMDWLKDFKGVAGLFGLATPSGSWWLLLHKLYLAVDSDFITYHHPPSFQCGIPVQSPVFAVEFAANGESGLLVSPRVFRHTPKFNVETDLFCTALDGKIAFQLIVVVVYFSHG